MPQSPNDVRKSHAHNNSVHDNNAHDVTSRPWANHPAYLKWLRDFFRALFDFEFHESVTVKMLPLVYGLGIFTSAIFAGYTVVNAFSTSFWRGLGFLFVLGPLTFLFATMALRSLLEFFAVVFRIQHRMHQLLTTIRGLHTELQRVHQEMKNLTHAVDNVASQTGDMARTVNDAKTLLSEWGGLTDRIPFFRKPKKTHPQASAHDQQQHRQQQWAEAPLSEPFEVDIFSSPQEPFDAKQQATPSTRQDSNGPTNADRTTPPRTQTEHDATKQVEKQTE